MASREQSSGPGMNSHAFRPRAPEFLPNEAFGKAANPGLDGAQNNDQLRNMTYGQMYGYPDSTQMHHTRPRGSSQVASRAQMPYQGEMYKQGGNVGYAATKRAVFGHNQPDSRAVVPRSQPMIPLGQSYGGISDDLGRFELAFRELFAICRGFIATWVVMDRAEFNRQAPVMQYLPRVYTGFTENQAWSYIRQHMNNGLSRSCLFARVVVDFIVQRILVPSAWQGFNFQNDCRIQQLEDELSRGPSKYLKFLLLSHPPILCCAWDYDSVVDRAINTFYGDASCSRGY